MLLHPLKKVAFSCLCFVGVLVLLPPVAGQPAPFTQVPPSVLYVMSGNTAKLVWDYDMGNVNKDTAFTAYSPVWKFNSSSTGGTNIQIAYEYKWSNPPWQWTVGPTCPDALKDRIHKESNATLVISNVTTADSGSYGCTLTLLVPSLIVSTHVQLIVTDVPQIHPLPHSPRYIKEGDNLAITCSATGPPVPSVKWVNKDGTELHKASGTAALDIKNIQRSQSGLYKCLASNNPNEDPVHAMITVLVMYKPTIDASLSSSNISSWVGNKVTLKCFAHGLPAPYFTWYMTGNQQITSGVTNVTNGSHVTTTTTEESITYGSYKCQARNVAGFDEHLIYITQLFAPGLPNITMTEDDIEAVSITVSWTTPDYDGGTPVIDYKVQINKTKAPKEKTTSNNHVDFTGLEKNTKYEVKVFARNKVGYGNPSIKIITTKKQGPPSSPDIKLESNQTAITLSWSKPDENGGEITKYTIYANGDRIGDVTSNSELKYVIDIKELKPGTNYNFIVTATNKHGESVKDNNKSKNKRIPDVATPTKFLTTTVIVDKKPSGSSTTQQHKCSITGLAICLVILVISLILNLLQFLFIWRNMKKKGRNVNKDTKRKTTQQAVGDPVYANALEMEENPAPYTPQTVSPTIEYEPIGVSHGVNPQNDSTNKTARDMIDSTSIENPSHYQELSPQISGSVSKQNQPTYEPLHRQQFTNSGTKQPSNVPNTTYQQLKGIRKTPSDYQSLHSYGKP